MVHHEHAEIMAATSGPSADQFQSPPLAALGGGWRVPDFMEGDSLAAIAGGKYAPLHDLNKTQPEAYTCYLPAMQVVDDGPVNVGPHLAVLRRLGAKPPDGYILTGVGVGTGAHYLRWQLIHSCEFAMLNDAVVRNDGTLESVIKIITDAGMFVSSFTLQRDSSIPVAATTVRVA